MPNADDRKATDHIGPLRNEKTKTKAVRDGSQRVTKLYEAPAHVGDGQPCLCTVYVYSGSNTVPDGSMEVDAYWDSDWDTALDAIDVNGVNGYVEP